MRGFMSIFSSCEYFTLGFLGALGRTERQRRALGWLDRLLVARLVPAPWRYIMIGIARK
jgi:hypothetical protein